MCAASSSRRTSCRAKYIRGSPTRWPGCGRAGAICAGHSVFHRAHHRPQPAASADARDLRRLRVRALRWPFRRVCWDSSHSAVEQTERTLCSRRISAPWHAPSPAPGTIFALPIALPANWIFSHHRRSQARRLLRRGALLHVWLLALLPILLAAGNRLSRDMARDDRQSNRL